MAMENGNMMVNDYRFNIEIEADPKPQSRARHSGRFSARGKPIVYKDPKQRLWDGFIQKEILEQAPDEPFDAPLAVRLIFYVQRPSSHYTKSGKLRSWAPKYPSVKPDLSNFIKSVEDCGNGILWKDDARIVCQLTGKYYADDCPPRIVVSIEPLDDGKDKPKQDPVRSLPKMEGD